MYSNDDDDDDFVVNVKELDEISDSEYMDDGDDVTDDELDAARRRKQRGGFVNDDEDDSNSDEDDGAEELMNQKSHVRSLLRDATAASPTSQRRNVGPGAVSVNADLALAAPGETHVSMHDGQKVRRENTNADLDAMLDTLDVFNPRRKSRHRGTKKPGRKKGAIVHKLTPALQKLFSEATDDFVKSKLEQAASKCKIVLAGNVRAAAPWSLMAEIYEVVGKFEEGFHCRLVSASLDPDITAETWSQLGVEAFREHQMNEYAAFCFKKSLDIEPENLSVMWDLAYARMQMGRYKKAMLGYQRICELAPGNLQVAFNAAQTYLEHYDKLKNMPPDNCIKFLEVCADEFIQHNVELANYLSALYLVNCNYDGVVQVGQRLRNDLPDIPCTLHAKFAVAHIHTDGPPRPRAMEEIQNFLSKECAENKAKKGAIADIARAFLDIKAYDQARIWYEKLLIGVPGGDVIEDDVAVHFYIGWCDQAVGNKKNAISTWEKALRVNPQNENAYIRRSLSLLFEELGDTGKAKATIAPLGMKVLKREIVFPRLPGEHLVHREKPTAEHDEVSQSRSAIQLHQCQRLLAEENYDELINKYLPVLNAVVKYKDSFEAEGFNLMTMQLKNRYYHRMILDVHASRGFPIVMREWSAVLLQMSRLLIQRRRFVDALLVTPANVGKRPEAAPFKLMAIVHAFFLRDRDVFMSGLKVYMKRTPDSYGPGNIYSEVQQWTGDEINVQRLLERHASRDTSIPMLITLGNTFLQSGSLALAFDNYLRAYALDRDHELVILLVSITLLHRVMTKSVQERHLTALDALSYFYKYWKKRQGDQEACYNLARFFHQLGLLYLAIPYYRKVIEMSHVTDLSEYNPSDRDLLHEAAYNLYVIYYTSGSNKELARYYLFKYCVI
eukprot:CFRG0125T1